jgi:SAM-dependent methyltransferase
MTGDPEPGGVQTGRYSSYRRSWRARFNRRRYERVMQLVELKPTDRILDLGCGRARKSVAHYNRTNPIVGVDRFANERLAELGDNFRYSIGDASDLSVFDDRSFEVVVSFGLLEHLADAQVRAIAAQTPRLADRFAHVVPHPLAFVEPHTRMPFFGRWPAVLRTLYVRLFPRARPPEYWHRLYWRSAAHWRRLFGDPRLKVVNHWYGPLLLYQIIYGGQPDGERRQPAR